MQAEKIKHELMKYWRYDRGFTFVTSECINKSDITAINPKHLVEVEIKVSKSDFLKEFDGKSKNKTKKHAIYQGNRIAPKTFICPNFYYFCVTPNIYPFVKEYLDLHGYNNYGIMVCETYRLYGQKSCIRVARKPKPIHLQPPSLPVLYKVGKRVQSELISLYTLKLNKKRSK